MKKLIRSVGSNLLIRREEETSIGGIWIGAVVSVGYGVPNNTYQDIDDTCLDRVIYNIEDSIEIHYKDEKYDSIPHYKVHCKIIKEIYHHVAEGSMSFSQGLDTI